MGRVCGFLTAIGKESRSSRTDQHKEMPADLLLSEAVCVYKQSSSTTCAEELRIKINAMIIHK